MRRTAKSKALQVSKIGDRIQVVGSRGEWNVTMMVQFKDDPTRDSHGAQQSYTVPVRHDQYCIFTTPMEHREYAREMRDAVITVLADTPDQPVYVGVTNLEGVFEIVPFCARDFNQVWQRPRNSVHMIERTDARRASKAFDRDPMKVMLKLARGK